MDSVLLARNLPPTRIRSWHLDAVVVGSNSPITSLNCPGYQSAVSCGTPPPENDVHYHFIITKNRKMRDEENSGRLL